jgi:imidazolonepropionase-like amidohydrolase
MRNMMCTRATALAWAFVVAATTTAAAAPATAQYVDVPRPPAYALEDVTVVQPDGRRSEGVTVVVRGELIEAVGAGVAVPADAERVEGDSLVVYPGLVDGDGKADHEFPQPDVDRDDVEIWNAPRSLKGFMPARRLAAHLEADGADVADQRKQGLVAAAVHPAGVMMPGRGALLLYRKSASTPEALVVDDALGPTFQLRGGRGVYPATLFGFMAFFRQAFEDARHLAALAEAHAEDPRRMTTPAFDPDYAVLRRVLDGELPVYFEADQAADILRVLGLADEYGFRPIIVDGGEAWKVADELRRRRVPVLVSVDFPEPRRWDPESEEPLDAAAEREKEELENRYANAGRLADAGVVFALTSGGSGEILEGARKAVAYGLDPGAGLVALTETPARLFGIPHVPRIAEGLPATFVVTTGPLFDEETDVAATFIEGWLEEGEAPDAGPGDAADAVDFSGQWRTAVDTEDGRIDAVLRIEQEGATFEGVLEMTGEELEVIDGVIDGNEIRCTVVMFHGGERLEVEITGTVEGDEASGQADAGPLGEAEWTAQRVGPGGAR